MAGIMYTKRLEQLMELHPNRVVPLAVAANHWACPNCGGSEMVMLRIIRSGPHAQPRGKDTWLDISGKPGWYAAELHTDPCPVCQGDQRKEYLAKNCGLPVSRLHVSIQDFFTPGRFCREGYGLPGHR
jgi:hypothetical protein